ncbi:MAG: DALR domain-containing protein, partial [Thiohalobacterales bacterium]|nr:DALR domain-containing protein [Thiohalobacterales bacterium]
MMPATPQQDVAPGVAESLQAGLEGARSGFKGAMDDDFNSAGARGHLFDLVKAINTARTAGVDGDTLADAQDVLTELTGVLGLQLTLDEKLESGAGAFIDLLLEVRTGLREAQQWE